MKNVFCTRRPTRSYVGEELKPYSKYKSFLAKDFNNRCGYTDSPDFWFGGPITFHIDHFKPKSKYPDLTYKYSNLVYVCSYVNRAKSNDDSEFLIDPCEYDFNEYFSRDEDGNIVPLETSEHAKYMYIKLKMYLRRYGIIWMLENIYEKIEYANKVLSKPELADEPTIRELKDAVYDLYCAFHNYLKYLRAEK